MACGPGATQRTGSIRPGRFGHNHEQRAVTLREGVEIPAVQVVGFDDGRKTGSEKIFLLNPLGDPGREKARVDYGR